MSQKTIQTHKTSGSGFLRSVIARVIAIFMVASIIITTVAFVVFTNEIRRNKLAEHQAQLESVEGIISDRMQEINSIAYNIGIDSSFYLEPVDDNPNSGRVMSEMLERYLVGNSYIEHLAFCRVAEPDKLIICTGERSMREFFVTTFGMDEQTIEATRNGIHAETKTGVRIVGEGDNQFYSYSYPLPQLSAQPRAHVLVMVPAENVRTLISELLIDGKGAVLVYDAGGKEIDRVGAIEDNLDLQGFLSAGNAEETVTTDGGDKYVLQKTTSETNSWTYVSIVPYAETLSGLAGKQTAFIALVLVLMLVAVVLILASIKTQYRPIKDLAEQVVEGTSVETGDTITDERKLLSHTLASLRDDSAQKQKYENAFYEAEAASKAKTAFLSSMSHDIRTPMNAIIGMTALARKHIDDRDYVDECLHKVQLSSDYLLDIINNVLDMSRIESGRIPIAEEAVVIPALMDSVVSLMTSGVEAKAQTLHLDIGELQRVTVIGDNIHLVQVFVNILSNAVKFTPEQGEITIRVRQAQSDKPDVGHYVFTFSDTGIGIPSDFIGQVFDTFTRASGAASSRTEGTGLGMAIAKKLVEMMGGTISCDSTLGVGTTFTVDMYMPYANEEQHLVAGSASDRSEAHMTDPLAQPIDLSEKNILLVEDNTMNREIAKSIIAETKAHVVEADDGSIAVQVFSEQPIGYFDLIFMDIQMPVMNGYEATAAIRALEREDAQTVQIYAMTANTFDEDVRQVHDAGMNGHIGKPYNPTKLLSILAKVLANKK